MLLVTMVNHGREIVTEVTSKEGIYGRGMVTGVTPKIYPAARDTLVNGRRTVIRVTDQFHSAANLVTPPLHTRFYIRDPRSLSDARDVHGGGN
jgi:hypothetical protein